MVVRMISNDLAPVRQTLLMRVPRWLRPNRESIPGELRELNQWCNWRGILRHGKRTKIPFQPTGALASSTDPRTWTSFDEVWAAWSHKPRRFDGIGFLLSPDDPFAGIDLDHSRNPATGSIAIWAAHYLARLASYTELSPGGNLRVFIKGTLPRTGRRKGAVELYDSRRYLTVTGRHIAPYPTTIEPRQDVLDRLLKELFPQPAPSPSLPASRASSLSDEEVIRRAGSARNGARFLSLFRDGMTGGDWSAADFELMCSLLFWCGGDSLQTMRIFSTSALAQRSKWQQRDDYRERTMKAALSHVRDYYAPRSAIGLILRIVNG
jgi:primase-polymerase (primpol)-like protein